MRIKISITLLLITAFCHSQKMQLGKVTAEELMQKAHPKDTSAVAAILFSKGFTTFKYDRREDGFQAIHEYTVKLKIYKKEGLSFANFEIPYYIGFKNLRPEVLMVEDAATYNLVNGKPQKTKVSGNGILKEKVNQFWQTTSVVFPDAKIGSILEFRYKIISDNIHDFPTFRFQREIPVDQSEYQTEIPVNYQYKVVTKGLLPIKTEATQKSGSQSYENAYGHTETMRYTSNVITLSASNLPSIKDEEYVDNAENYQAAVDYELELIQFPNNPVRQFSESWESLAKTIYKDEDFGGQLKQNDYYIKELKLLVEGVESKQERMKKVFAFVQDRMNWNGRNGFYSSEGLAKAWASQTGNVADINLMLVSMLNMAGVETYPVLISTVGNGVAAFPKQTAFNYVIACAMVDGNKVLLDASDKFTLPGFVPLKTLNWNGRLIKPDGNSEAIDMSQPAVSRKNCSVMCEISADGSVKGKSRLQHNDLAAMEFRRKYSGTDKNAYAEYLEKKCDGITIENYAVQNEKRSAEPVVESFEFMSLKHAEAIGDKIYIDPLLFFTARENPFTAEERTMPVFFGYPSLTRYVITVKVPQGYAVESIPEAISMSTGENVVTFKFACQHSNGNVSISASYESATMLVNAGFYPNIKNFFGQLVEKQGRKIVLKKV